MSSLRLRPPGRHPVDELAQFFKSHHYFGGLLRVGATSRCHENVRFGYAQFLKKTSFIW